MVPESGLTEQPVPEPPRPVPDPAQPVPEPTWAWNPQQPYPQQPHPAQYPAPHQYPPGFQPGPDQVFWPAVPVKPAALPVVPREYHEFFRAPRFRWWRPLLGLAMFVAVWFISTLVVTVAALGYDALTGRTSPGDLATPDDVIMTPALFTANNIGLGLAIPIAGLTAWAVFGQRPRWMSSIFGGFRWGLFWRFSLVAAGIFLAGLAVSFVIGGEGDSELRWNADSAFLIAAILLTTPFQAAGEEYGVRGFLARSIGSWFGARRVGFVVATVITSVVFMMLHAADNIWLNIYYFSVGVVCSVLVWRTGGLEAAVALHVFNNLISEITLPFVPLDDVFARGPNDAGPDVLVQLVFTVSVMAVMLWIAKRQGVTSAAAPGSQPVAGP